MIEPSRWSKPTKLTASIHRTTLVVVDKYPRLNRGIFQADSYQSQSLVDRGDRSVNAAPI
jgi:hypothetical protein